MSLKNNLLYHTCSLNIYNYKYYHKFRSKVDLVEATLFQMKTRLCSEVSQLDCSQGHKKKQLISVQLTDIRYSLVLMLKKWRLSLLSVINVINILWQSSLLLFFFRSLYLELNTQLIFLNVLI